MPQNNHQDLIRLSCSDRNLQDYFFYKLCQSFPVSKGQKELLVKQNMSIEQISEVKDLDFQQWIFYIQGKQYAFTFNYRQEKQFIKSDHTILLFETGDDIQQQFLQQLKLCLNKNPNIFLIICKPSLKIKDTTIKKFEKKALELLRDSLQIGSQKVNVVHTCLEGVDDEFKNKICLWFQQKKIKGREAKRSNKESNFEVLKELSLQLQGFQIKNKQNCINQLLMGNFQQASMEISKLSRKQFIKKMKANKVLNEFLITSKQNKISKIQDNLKEIIQKYQIEEKNQCLQLLLQGNIDEAVLYAKKQNRMNFKQDLMNQKKYIQFIDSLNNTQTQKEKSPYNQLKILLQRYDIKNQQQCIEQIIEKNIDDSVTRVRKADRDHFKNNILSCQALIQYWNLQIPIKGENQQQILRKQAENVVKQLLEVYGASDVEQFCLQILQNKLQEVILEIPNKHRQKFRKQCQQCEILQKYLNYQQKTAQIDLKQEAKQQLQILLKKYKVKNEEAALIQLFQNSLDDAVVRVGKKDRQLFKSELNKCKQYRTYLESLKKPDEKQTLKNESIKQINQLLEKYEVVQRQQMLENHEWKYI